MMTHKLILNTQRFSIALICLLFFFRLTDAINETKDKVKYLESLRRYFDQLYEDNSPSHIANNVIPSITAAIRQMDNISKFYARSGYLGIVFAKVYVT